MGPSPSKGGPGGMSSLKILKIDIPRLVKNGFAALKTIQISSAGETKVTQLIAQYLY